MTKEDIQKRLEELALELAKTDCLACKKVIVSKIEDYKARLLLHKILESV